MKKIKIIVDGSSGAKTSDVLVQYPDISVVYIPVLLDGKDYANDIPELLYRDIENSADFPTTKEPNVEDILKIAEDAEYIGYTDIIFITLSSGISTTYETSKSIPDLIKGNIKFHSFDSLTTSANQLELTRTAAKMASDGKTVDEIFKVLEEMRKSLFSYFLVDDLDLLIRNGRLKGASAIVGNLLKIKPILSMEKHVKGEIHTISRARTSRRAARDLVSFFLKELGNTKPKVIHLIHARMGETYDDIIRELKIQKPGYENLVEAVKLPNIIAAHVGTTLYALQYVEVRY